MGLALFTAADAELVSLEEAKGHLHVDIDEQDEQIVGYIAAARAHLEGICGRSFLSTVWDHTIDYDWPWILDIEYGRHVRMIELPRAPLSSVTSISYVDGAGATQVLNSSQYVVDGAGAIGRVYQAYDASWPTVRSQPRAITVRFVAGYGTDPDSVPKPIKQANLLLISHFHEQRQPVVVGQAVNSMPLAVDALIAPYRVYF
jgi:uncharacterized phiE125 gp8 family phage protein